MKGLERFIKGNFFLFPEFRHFRFAPASESFPKNPKFWSKSPYTETVMLFNMNWLQKRYLGYSGNFMFSNQSSKISKRVCARSKFRLCVKSGQQSINQGFQRKVFQMRQDSEFLHAIFLCDNQMIYCQFKGVYRTKFGGGAEGFLQKLSPTLIVCNIFSHQLFFLPYIH